MKWTLTKDLPELEGKIFQAKWMDFLSGDGVPTKTRLRNRSSMRLTGAIPYSIYRQQVVASLKPYAREEAEELVFQWMHPEQSDIEEAEKWTKWITEHIVPYHGNPF